MRIKDLTIKNYKSLVEFELVNAPDIVVLAGPNGTGKSSVLEAIVFFKESLGPYHGWTLPGTVVNTAAQFAEISIRFKVFPEEIVYLKKVHNIELKSDILEGYLKIDSNGRMERKAPTELRSLMSAYRKDFPSIGIFDFYNPYRFIGRKRLMSIAVEGFTDPEEKRRRVTFLPAEKFARTKDYLAQCALGDIQTVITKVRKEQVKIGMKDVPDSLRPIKRIFNNLLAPKKFSGVDLSTSPIRFVVETPQGEVDIDDLSSGEKEILFGYTELLKLHPQNSIILYDEPDLHLNQEVERKIVPLLRSIGTNNQFWIATHSFGIMDSVEYNELFRLENHTGRNQLTRAFSDKEKWNTFRSVAGDIGIITLGQRIVFLEGAEWTDKRILETFSEEYKRRIVFVSSGSVGNVTGVSQKILDLLHTSSKFNFYCAIRDRDFMDTAEREQIMESGNQRLYVWERYHIENYLLDFKVIYDVLKRNISLCPCSSAEDVKEKIIEILHQESDRFLSMMVKYDVNKELRTIYFDVGFPGLKDQALKQAKKLKDKLLTICESDTILGVIERNKKEFKVVVESGEWIKRLPGRTILKLFIGKYGRRLSYDPFKNQLVHEMKERDRVPKEMKDVLSQFLRL